ncbi:MAG: GIY-YIG nuclease family protein [Sulfolobales archaeon]
MVRGVYYLVIELVQDLIVNVGRLGSLNLTKGTYVYVGSGKGPGGIYKRVLRHYSKSKKVFWHIDYLTVSNYVKVVNAVVVAENTLNESSLTMLVGIDECFKPVAEGFGCSDVRNDRTHLFKYICHHDVIDYLIRKLINFGVNPSLISLISD